MNESTLLDALDTYAESIRKNAVDPLHPAIHQRCKMVALIKAHATPLPVADLNLDVCTALIEHWRNRPGKRNGKPFCRSTAKRVLAELFRFFAWLDSSREFEWTVPSRLQRADRRVRVLQSDKASVRLEPYSIAELSLLYQHATDIERLMLALSLNCGLRAVDLVRLKAENFVFDHRHENASHLGLPHSHRGAYLRLHFPKTKILGEWNLWPETEEVVRAAVKQSRSLKAEHLFVAKSGAALIRDESINPASVVENRFRRLVKRVQAKHPEFRCLPFGSVRRAASGLLMASASPDVVQCFLGHSVRSTVSCYRYRPYSQLFQALQELRQTLQPVFAKHSR